MTLTPLSVVALLGLATPAGAAEPPTHGPVFAELSADSVVVWARAAGPGELELRLSPRLGWRRRFSFPVDPARGLTGTLPLEGLRPDIAYTVRIVHRDAEGRRSEPVLGRFRTAPEAEVARPVRFALGGDLGGQGRCRRLAEDGTELGYPILAVIAAAQPDFFIMNGDQIYADATCPPEGPDPNEIGRPWRNVPGPTVNVADPTVDWSDATALRASFLEHWRYNREEANYQSLLRGTGFYAQWDDHEVVNDQGLGWTRWHPEGERAGFPTLVAEGRRAFFDYNPVAAVDPAGGGIYRSFRWGADLELFLVDARSFRSPNAEPDAEGAGKTMLGAAQREWLLRAILASDATFKVVSVDVPLAQPTGSRAEARGRDGWADGAATSDAEEGAAATGFERELLGLMEALDRAHARNLVFLATDVHFPQIARFSVDLDGDGDPLVLHEIIAGPLSAGASPAVTPDPTLNPQVLYAEGGIFNYALVEVAREAGVPTLRVRVIGEDGATRPGGELSLQAR